MSMNAYQTYKKTQVSTASQGELIVMLFDGAIRFTNQAKDFIEAQDFANANEKIVRTENIISELISSLDMEVGEMAQNLYQLYTFVYEHLVQANIKKDPSLLDEVLGLLMDLRDTWRQVVNVKQ